MSIREQRLIFILIFVHYSFFFNKETIEEIDTLNSPAAFPKRGIFFSSDINKRY
jgi:hypothetical protein